MNKKYSVLLMLLSGFFFVQAANAGPGQGYLVAGFGQASVDISDDGFEFEGDDTSFKIGGGYQISENGAFEVYYINYGEAEDSIDAGAPFGIVDVGVEATALVFQGVGMFPASPTVDIIGKIGLAMWDAELSVEGSDIGDDDGTDLTIGLGAAFKMGASSSIRVEYDMADFDDADVTVIGVAFTHSFQ